jgi:hypothetical protein
LCTFPAFVSRTLPIRSRRDTRKIGIRNNSYNVDPIRWYAKK